MENNNYLYSVLNGKNNEQSIIEENNNSNIKLINYHKINTKRTSFAQRKSRHSIFDPFHLLNLKTVAEDIKHKIFEMNKQNNSNKNVEQEEDKKNEINEKPFLRRETDEINPSSLRGKNELGNGTEKDMNNQMNNKLINISRKQNKKSIHKVKLNTKKSIRKLRKLNIVKNLSDSNDDDESEEEEEHFFINPETKVILIFDFFIIIFYVYYFIYTTLNLCRERCYCSSNANINFSDIILFINDLLCIVDMGISFFRGFYKYELVKSNKLILINYLKYDFIFDFLCAIPFYSISKYICFKESYNDNCYKYEIPSKILSFKLCSLFKSFKIKKIMGHKKNEALDKFLELISENYTIEKIVTIIIYSTIYIGIFHFIVCIHIFIGNNSYSNWLILTHSENASIFHIYITSLYFLITTLTTVGYGDITCQSLLERIFQIIILAIGSVLYPYVVSSIGNFIRNDSNAKIKLHNDLSMLEKIRRGYPNLNFKLYHEIYQYLERKGSSLEKYDLNSFIETLPFTLKINVLFCMYKTTIENFNFFNKNNNSVFIAEVLNHFIPSISKKNEFLVVEGEMMEEIIFLREGKITLNAAIDMENQMDSIYNYFTENFLPFLTEEEKAIINENVNNKIFIDDDEDKLIGLKMKSNHSLKSVKNIKNREDKGKLQIHNLLNKNEYIENKTRRDSGNEEDNFHYLKIVDILKYEHFGCVFISLNKPVPLSLQVKSKIVELFLLKKEDALKISKSHQNIWKNICDEEMQNFIIIKKYTFSTLRKYIKINKLLSENKTNLKKRKIDLTTIDLNILQKLIELNKQLKKTHILKGAMEKKRIIKSNTSNYEFMKNKKKLNINRNDTHKKTKIEKKSNIKNKPTFLNKDSKILKIKNLNLLYSVQPQVKTVHFSDAGFKNEDNKKASENSLINSPAHLKNKNLDSFENYENEEQKHKLKKEKLKNLKSFLIECKKYFKNNKLNKNINTTKSMNKEKQESLFPTQTKKYILKNKRQETKMSETQKENIEIKSLIEKQLNFISNRNNTDSIQEKEVHIENKNFPDTYKLLKDLEDICEEETDFSFCSTNEGNSYAIDKLAIDNNSSFEILSAYPNLNKITKGRYIKDYCQQKKLKMLLTKFYKYKHDHKKAKLDEPLFLRTIGVESDNKSSKDKSDFSKNEEINNSSDSSYKLKKLNNMNNIFNEKTDIKEMRKRKSLTTKKLLIKDNKNENDLQQSSSNKKQNKKDVKDNFDIESIKMNKSETLSKKAENDKSENLSNKNSLCINIRKDVNVINNNEVEYIIDKGINHNINNDSILMDNNSNKNNNHQIHKNKDKKKKHHNKNKSNKNKELINQILDIKIPNVNITTNNIITTTSNIKDSKNEFNSFEKMKNIENVSIYNIINKNINKNLNIIDNNEKGPPNNYDKNFCCIF